MESLQQSLLDIKEMCTTRMAEFQASLEQAVATGSPPVPTIASLHADFTGFRRFVVSTIESLQKQVDILAHECDRLEMAGRRKILLVHGVPEASGEDTTNVFLQTASRMKLPLTRDALSRCQRLGRSSKDKPRPLLVQFCRVDDRDRVWYAKTTLKGTGVTVSEFLTRGRHNTFLEARKRLGVSKCWTRSGVIIIAAPDGKQHRITSLGELNKVCGPSSGTQAATTSSVQDVASVGRTRRNRR